MSNKSQFSSYLTYGLISAILFCIPATFFIRSGDFRQIYLLYLGNALFLIGILLFLLQYNKKRAENASTSSMLISGHLTAVTGIVIACILSLLLVFIFSPDVFSSHPDTVLENANPAQQGIGKPRGVLFVLFMDAIIGNFCTGSFVSLLFPYTIKKDQTKDKASEFVNIRKVDKDQQSS